jgi:hypothetical protein
MFFVEFPDIFDLNDSLASSLQVLSRWLVSAYKKKVRLMGIVFVRRISDTSISGNEIQVLRTLRGMVGESNPGAIVFAMTHWDSVGVEEGLAREEELRKILDEQLGGGCKVMRQDRGAVSASKVVEHLLSQRSYPLFALQRQLVDEGLALGRTGAGITVLEYLNNQKGRIMALEDQEHFEQDLTSLQEETRQLQDDRDDSEQGKVIMSQQEGTGKEGTSEEIDKNDTGQETNLEQVGTSSSSMQSGADL